MANASPNPKRSAAAVRTRLLHSLPRPIRPRPPCPMALQIRKIDRTAALEGSRLLRAETSKRRCTPSKWILRLVLRSADCAAHTAPYLWRLIRAATAHRLPLPSSDRRCDGGPLHPSQP